MASCKTWNREMTREFSLYKLIMWPIGSWPLDRNKNFAKFRAFLLIVTQATMLAGFSMEIIYHDGATLTHRTIDHLVLATCGLLAIVKTILIRLHRDDLLKNLCNAANDWICIAKQDQHRQIMFRYTNLSRLVFFVQMSSTYLVIGWLVTGPIFSSMMLSYSGNETLRVNSENEIPAMELPQKMNCPIDGYITCVSIYIFQTIQLICTATANVGSDVFLFGVCMHLCGQLEVFGMTVLQFPERKNGNDCGNRSELIALIERHSLLLNLAKDVVVTLDIILLAQLILHAMLICFIGLQFIISLAAHDALLVVRGIVSFNISMVELFVYSYMGEILSLKTQDISRSVYLVKWYDLPTNIVRDLYFMIDRANVPVRITAGKFYYMDLNNFKNILKASVSYFSVLQIMVVQ